MITWILGAIGALLLWLVWELVGQILGEILWGITAPVRQPIWRAFVFADWPWPLLLMVMGGAAAAVLGLNLIRNEHRGWHGPAGFGLFFSGTFFAIAGGFLWRDAKRERSKHDSRHQQAAGEHAAAPDNAP